MVRAVIAMRLICNEYEIISYIGLTRENALCGFSTRDHTFYLVGLVILRKSSTRHSNEYVIDSSPEYSGLKTQSGTLVTNQRVHELHYTIPNSDWRILIGPLIPIF